jgi:CBS domain-containing protein
MSGGLTARELLAKKGSNLVVTVRSDISVQEACKLLRAYNIGCLVISDSAGRIEGIFTERDVVNRVVAENRSASETKIGEVMTREVIVVEPDRTLEEIEAIMKQNRIRHLPVAGNESLIGMLSIGDVLAHHAAEDRQMVRYLTEYIYGRV